MEAIVQPKVYLIAVPSSVQTLSSEFVETAQSAASWATSVMLGIVALLFLAGFLSFLIWKAGN